MSIDRITLTGADECTQLDRLVEMVERWPAVEIGLLYSLTPESRPRYPGRSWVARAARRLSGRCAVHVCGAGARQELLDGYMADITVHAPRVQVNGRLQVREAEALAARVGTLITQHNESNAALLQVRASNHQLLVDASGGRGVSPTEWQAPETEKAVGFAGGMGPENLLAEMGRIARVARKGGWVDMENRLRIDDWFSVDLAEECSRLFVSRA